MFETFVFSKILQIEYKYLLQIFILKVIVIRYNVF